MLPMPLATLTLIGFPAACRHRARLRRELEYVERPTSQPRKRPVPQPLLAASRFRLQTKATFGSIEHRLCGLDLVVPAARHHF
jgi:hypothetical protein